LVGGVIDLDDLDARHRRVILFVDFDLINRIIDDLINRMVGVSPCHPQARAGVVVFIQTYVRVWGLGFGGRSKGYRLLLARVSGRNVNNFR